MFSILLILLILLILSSPLLMPSYRLYLTYPCLFIPMNPVLNANQRCRYRMILRSMTKGRGLLRLNLALGCVLSFVLSFVMSFVMSAGLCQAAPSFEPVQSLKPLLFKALALGEAKGELVGENQHYLQNTFLSREPIRIEVTAMKPMDAQGCSPLRVITEQKAVYAPKLTHALTAHATAPPSTPSAPSTPNTSEEAEDQRLVFQIVFCRNGQLPNLTPPQ